ncbi:MAG: TolC family protein, partial [Achromobacter sp.]|nr:TolC family protein [Achromobacter sp.]
MRKSRLSLILLPLLASACAAGPAYAPRRPPAASAGPFITTVDGIDRAGDLPDDWWRLYRDPALDSLIEQALAANTDLRVASANLARARAIIREARAGRLPSTEVSGGVSYGDSAQVDAPVGNDA